MSIKLIEVCDTWQGEGPCTGRQMLLVRFKKCNLKCFYCDSMIKMKQSSEGSYSIEDLNKSLEKTKGLMVTGGEPTFAENYDQTIMMLKKLDYQIANIETNGCQIVKLLEDIKQIKNNDKIKIIYSPKVFNENGYKNEINKIKDIINDNHIYLKIVPECGWSKKFIREVSKLTDDKNKIFLMPLGASTEEIASSWAETIDLADELNLNLSTRMHIMNNFV